MAARLFSRELETAAHAIYWFCRHTDDLVDEAPSIEQGRRDLEAWSLELDCALNRGESSHPVLRLFVETVRRYRIPEEYPRDLIEGMRMDLNGVRYRTFDELRTFCYRVASVVGLMMARVIGTVAPADSYAVDLGIAMQLTNILRDVGEDLGRGRVYLPDEDLERYGYRLQELRGRVFDDRFVNLMRFQIARARDYYAKAEPGISLLNPDGRFAVRVASDIYRGILGRIERNRYDVFSRRAVVPSLVKYTLIVRAMAAPAARYSTQKLAFWRVP